MIEKQPTSLTPPPQSDELISSVVGSILKRQELTDVNPDEIESDYGRPYAYKIRQLQQEENQRLQVAATERSRPKERRPVPLKRRIAQGALALSLVAGVTPFVVNAFHHDDQASTTHDSDTVLTPKDWPVDHGGLNPPSAPVEKVQPELPPAEYLPPKEPGTEVPPSDNARNNGDIVDNPGGNPLPDNYDNPPPEPGNW